MAVTAVLVARIQFAFTVSFHIIFPSFTYRFAHMFTAAYLPTSLVVLPAGATDAKHRVKFKVCSVAFRSIVRPLGHSFQCTFRRRRCRYGEPFNYPHIW